MGAIAKEVRRRLRMEESPYNEEYSTIHLEWATYTHTQRGLR